MTWTTLGCIAVGMGFFTVALVCCAALMNRAIEVYHVEVDGPAVRGDTPPVACGESESEERSVA